jgi:hypothetical protein
MAAEAPNIISPNIISSRLISHNDFIALIYGIVKDAAAVATAAPQVIENKNKLCILPVNESGVTRTSRTRACEETTSAGSIIYSPDDILIAGGAVLNIYDSLLTGFKARRDIKQLKEYITRDTLDIDMKWWPREAPTRVIATSKSKAIVILAETFKDALKGKFDDASIKTRILEKIQSYSELDGIINLTVDISLKDIRYVGAHSLNITLKIKDTTEKEYALKMCDISIYDNGSSQDYTMEGELIGKLQPMHEDPNYSSPFIGSPNTMKIVPIEDANIALPSLDHYIYQQIFAFNNQMREMNSKAFINYRRIMFILLLLHKYIPSINKSNFKNIMNTTKNNSAKQMTLYMKQLIKKSIDKYYENIKSICRRTEISKDDIFLKGLCLKVSLPIVELVQNTSNITKLVPKHLITSRNRTTHIPVFSSPEEARAYAASMPPRSIGRGYKRHKIHKTRKHKK